MLALLREHRRNKACLRACQHPSGRGIGLAGPERWGLSPHWVFAPLRRTEKCGLEALLAWAFNTALQPLS